MLFLLLSLELLVDAKQIPSSSNDHHQCVYNGQTYNEGEEIISARKLCLSCICTKEFIEPNDYNCTVIECTNIEPLERGCIPIYDNIECCPISWNCTGAQPLNAKCDKRYFQHYEVKGCTPVYEKGATCPARFNCPEITPQNNSVCSFKGRTYSEGETVDVANPCRQCVCRQNFSGGVYIDCIFVECPHVFMPPLNGSCYNIYEDGQCCPNKTQCSAGGPSQITDKVCEYNGKSYHYGERIYPSEDRCQICVCNEQWTGVGGNSCRTHACELELKRQKLIDGCIPIYHEATCCPIEIYCGTPEEGYKNTTVSFAKKEDISSGKTCIFKGTHYSLGQVLNINHPTHCVTCSCVSPPDFTCIHKSCPRPPNDDYENCESTYIPGECCPTYDCKPKPDYSGKVSPIQCSPVVCPEGCSEVTVHNSCPLCMCHEKLCSYPKCKEDCVVQKTVPAGECPTCECPDNVLMAPPSYDEVKCPDHCFEVKNPNGYPVCMCGPVCVPPKCDPGCELNRDVREGECPNCKCHPSSDIKLDQVHCSPVKCIAGCTEEVSTESGCPMCVCKPQCSTPKCEPGCYLNPFPTGPCPECVCEDKESVPQLLCAPVKCGPLCHEAFDRDGCSTCLCDPQCSVPVCGKDCHLESSTESDPCPKCVCEDEACPSITCGAMCEKRIGSDGCPTCSCDSLCTAPKCEMGCHLEYDRSAGPCPSCVCPNFNIPVVRCSMPKCDEGCQIDYDARPCPACSCNKQSISEIQCSPPKCDAGCHIDNNAKPCPACVCDKLGITEIQCSPPKCDAGCHIDNNAKPCPACVCDKLGLPTLRCTMPLCKPGCHIDITTKPCPSCTCSSLLRKSPFNRIRCAPVKCPEGCSEDFTTKPCPSCNCAKTTESLLDSVQCSPVQCPDGCHTDYNTKPCPSCSCTEVADSILDIVQCSPVKCPAGCHTDYTTKPCPSCNCADNIDVDSIQCSPPRCLVGCRIDYSAKPCPHCVCDSSVDAMSRIRCSPLKCREGCHPDYSTKPCPKCKCVNESQGIPDIMCSMPLCDPDCHLDYSTKPCPSCNCDNQGIPDIMCSMPKCDPGCHLDYTTKPCPSCNCDSQESKLQCSTPKCDFGCHLDFSAEPCPTCVCDKFHHRLYEHLPVPDFRYLSDPFCRSLRCGLGCEMDRNASSTERCPMCICDGRVGEKIKCMPMQCQLPCRFKRFSPYGCPTCICHSFSSVPGLLI